MADQRGQDRGSSKVDLGDYIDVAARIVEFREKYPDGSLQLADPATPYRVERIGDTTYLAVVAAAYRNPQDPRPGIGTAWEVVPGRTPYTRNSELQNAETSAWGRAIVAALAADTKRGIASAEEVRNRRAEQDLPASRPADRAQGKQARARRDEDPWAVHPLTDDGKQQLRDLLVADDPDRVRAIWREIRAYGKEQTVTLQLLGAQHAAALAVEGNVDLFDLATRVGEHLKENGISVAEHVAALAAPVGDTEPAAAGRDGGQQG